MFSLPKKSVHDTMIMLLCHYFGKAKVPWSINKMFILIGLTAKLVIETDPNLYFFINQGCLTVDNMDDAEEMKATDVGGPPDPNIGLPDPISGHPDPAIGHPDHLQVTLIQLFNLCPLE